MKKQTLPLLIILLTIPFTIHACSCDWTTFCHILYGDTEAYVIKGVVSTKTYQDDYQAVYVDVLEEYRDDFGIDKKRIKLLGSEHSSWCDIDVHDKLRYKDTVYIGLMYLNDFAINNPDSIKDKSSFVMLANLCTFRLIKPISEENLGGYIKGERGDPDQIFEYPKRYFERDLVDCNFSSEVIKNHNCDFSDFIIYPNPISSSTFKVKTKLKYFSLDYIEVYNMYGVLVHVYNSKDSNYKNEYDASFLPVGTYIFRINCKEKVITRKIFIM